MDKSMNLYYFSGKIQDRIDKKAAYFHLVAWSLPLILTITTMAFGEVITFWIPFY